MVVKKVILFGASHFSDEVVQMLRDINSVSHDTCWDIVGFLDDDDNKKLTMQNGVTVLGNKKWANTTIYTLKTDFSTLRDQHIHGK